MNDIDNIQSRTWDAIVVGTGMGGATLGYALAKKGKSVLFCEQGRSHLFDHKALRGNYAELFFSEPDVPGTKHRGLLARSGRYYDVIEDLSGKRPKRFIPFIGSGSGGSSAIYGMALERFLPEDFKPRQKFSRLLENAPDSSLPESWPIDYEDLAPYYAQAEQLYGVRGGADPLRKEQGADSLGTAPPFSPASKELVDFLQDKGLHPYRLPTACEFLPGCRSCQGFLCTKACKNDSGRICLTPAIQDHGAVLLDRCRVMRIEADRARVTAVACRYQGQDIELTSKIVVLAAGALQSPMVLLRSRSDEWPKGLANEHDLVGRNLMRHCVDLYAVSTNAESGDSDNSKEIAFNDFYVEGSRRLGSVQSFGKLPPPRMIVEALEQDIRDSSFAAMAGAFGLAKPLIMRALARKFSNAQIFASLLEDLPYHDNRVLPLRSDHGGDIVLRYQLHSFEKERIAEFRRELSAVLKPYSVTLLKQAENNERIAHACGTCRFGLDPKDSVLDRDNRAHGLENLYVVDSSFFPSSAGTNPSLTIAANALRVADQM